MTAQTKNLIKHLLVLSPDLKQILVQYKSLQDGDGIIYGVDLPFYLSSNSKSDKDFIRNYVGYTDVASVDEGAVTYELGIQEQLVYHQRNQVVLASLEKEHPIQSVSNIYFWVDISDLKYFANPTTEQAENVFIKFVGGSTMVMDKFPQYEAIGGNLLDVVAQSRKRV